MIEEKNGYREEYLGKPAIFSIPSPKLESVEYEIHNFLRKNYGQAWSQTPNVEGFWMGKSEGKWGSRFQTRIKFRSSKMR